MTEVQKKSLNEFPDNLALREAYEKGAKEIAMEIWAKLKVEETRYTGKLLDEQIPLSKLTTTLERMSDFCYYLYHELEDED